MHINLFRWKGKYWNIFVQSRKTTYLFKITGKNTLVFRYLYFTYNIQIKHIFRMKKYFELQILLKIGPDENFVYLFSNHSSCII